MICGGPFAVSPETAYLRPLGARSPVASRRRGPDVREREAPMNMRTVKIRRRPATARPRKYERPEEPRKARARAALIVIGTLAGLTMDLACRPGVHKTPPPSAAVDATTATTAVPAAA